MSILKLVSIALWSSLLFGCATVKPTTVKQRCQLGICLIYTERFIDTDGDGFSNVDEIAAGTDPFDRDSFPSINHLTTLISVNSLPSYRLGVSELVVLPTTTPDGRMLLPEAWTTNRKSALERLGLTDERLQNLGLAGTSGFRIQLEHPSSDSRTGPFTGFRVGGIPISLISDSTEAGITAKEKDILMQTARSKSEDEDPEMRSVNYRSLPKGGSSLDVVWSNGDQIQVSIQKRGEVVIRKNNNDLTTSSVETVTVTESRASDGAHVRAATSRKDDESGNRTETVYIKTWLNRSDGSGYVKDKIETTTKDKNGNVVSKVVKEETVTKDKDGTRTTVVNTTTCQGDNPCTTTATMKKGLYDPEVAGTMVVPTLAQMKKVIEARGGSSTTPGPVQEGPILNAWPIVRYGILNPLVVHLDPDYQSFFATGTPRVDRAKPEVVPDFTPVGQR